MKMIQDPYYQRAVIRKRRSVPGGPAVTTLDDVASEWARARGAKEYALMGEDAKRAMAEKRLSAQAKKEALSRDSFQNRFSNAREQADYENRLGMYGLALAAGLGTLGHVMPDPAVEAERARRDFYHKRLGQFGTEE
jgi:hypothetical protein